MRISGFGYCSAVGHKHVDVFEDDANGLYVRIDFYRSEGTFKGMDDLDGLWRCVTEVERNFLPIGEF